MALPTVLFCEYPPLRARTPSPNIHWKAGDACVTWRGLLEVVDLDDKEQEEEEEEERGIRRRRQHTTAMTMLPSLHTGGR